MSLLGFSIIQELVDTFRDNGELKEKLLAEVKAKKRVLADDARLQLRNTWQRWFKFQPLWKIRNYFGEKIAMYFAWSGTLIMTLWIPAVLGIIIFFYGLYLR